MVTSFHARMPRLAKTLTLTFAVFLLARTVTAEEECMTQAVFCYECDSEIDPRCADPFNYSESDKDSTKTRCEGCCVKIVRNKGTPYETVWRTCTRNIKINLFMVDHVCMYESNRHGHMCFCEEDLCNTAHRRQSTPTSLALVVAVLLGAIWRRL